MISIVNAASPEPFNAGTFTEIESNIPGFRFEGSNINAFFSGPYGITTVAFFFAGVIIVLYSLSAGLGLMVSRGDPKAVASNKQKLTNALIGFIILFSSYWIVQIIAIVLGLQGITEIFRS